MMVSDERMNEERERTQIGYGSGEDEELQCSIRGSGQEGMKEEQEENGEGCGSHVQEAWELNEREGVGDGAGVLSLA